MDGLYYFVNLAFYKILFLSTGTLAGWTESQAMVFVAGYLVVDAIQMTMFANNVWWLPVFVNKGDLDYYLVRPVSTLFFISLRDFAANSFINLIMASGILAWALNSYPEPLPAWKVLLFILLILNGTLLHYLIHFGTMLPVFWTHSGKGISAVFHNFTRFMERPDRIFRGWIHRVITTFIPFALIASFPARLLIEPFNPWLLLHIFVVTIVLFRVLLYFWSKGLRNYSSASS
jgi:ABC-2 type transport system permease protein